MKVQFEIVHVITASQVIDSESYQRTLGTMHVGRLRPGFYVVYWPLPTAVLRYDASADFVGPFKTRYNAELAHTIMDEGSGWRATVDPGIA
jgi:hypothetical protein